MKRFLTALIMLILVSPAFAVDSELKDLTEVTNADGTYLMYTTTAAGASRYSTIANLLTDANLPNDLTINSTKTITTTANVGVGSTSPRAKLDVDGAIYATEYYGSGANLTGLSTTDIYWTGTSTNLVAADARTSLGMGSIYPLNAGTMTNTKYCTYDSGSTAIVCNSSSGAVTETDPKVGTLTDGYHPKWSSTTLVDSIIYDNGTQVGIGSPNPSYKLDIAGGERVTGQIVSTLATGTSPFSVASTTVNANLNADLLDGHDTAYFQIAGSYLTAVTADSPLSGSGTSGSHLVLSTAGTWSGNAGTATALAANGSNCSAGSYPLGVDASGAVEDCTAVSSGITGLTAGKIPRASNATTIVDSSIYENGGNVGIGTTVPVYGLSVKGTVGIGATTSGDTLVATGGNVGIGSTAPQAKLVVVGTGTNTFTGNVGINSTSPTSTLAIDGTIYSKNLTIGGSHGSAYYLCLGIDGTIYGQAGLCR